MTKHQAVEPKKTKPKVHIVFGQQGAGKTSYALELAEKKHATRFSIDEWMNELFGPDLPQPLDFQWIMERVKRCENRIWQTALAITQKDGKVILDLGFMKREDRSNFELLAKQAKLYSQLHYVTAPLDLRKQRVSLRNRSQNANFSFEVTPEMFDFMETQFEAPKTQELSKAIIVNTQ